MNLIDIPGKVLAVDFDGTVVEHKYPEPGDEMLFAFATLKALQQKGHWLILWTYRTGNELQEAVDFCRTDGLEFYAVNENYPGEIEEGNFSRKINADIFIDDRNVGGFLGWDVIWQTLHPEGKDYSHQLKHKTAHLNFKLKNKKTRFKLS